MEANSLISNELKAWSDSVIKNQGTFEKKYIDSINSIVDISNTSEIKLSKNRKLLLIKINSNEISYLSILINGNKYETYGILKTTLNITETEFLKQFTNSVQNSKLSNKFYYERFDIHNKRISRMEGILDDKIKETYIEKGIKASGSSNNSIKSNSCDNYYLVIKVDGVIVYYEFLYSVCNNAAIDMPDPIYSGNGNVELEDKIITDTSIMNNPNVKCVYENLSKTVLKDILAGFSNSEVYNLRFTLDPNLPSDKEGKTKHISQNEFLISINPFFVDDYYSKIWLASTFIHEAFHAQLYLKVQETFSGQDFSKWPKPIDDMDLQELMNYYENRSKEENIWNSTQHDWMVNHIELMAQHLQNFVRVTYPLTFNLNSNFGLNPYLDLMYRGLEKSVLYEQKFPNGNSLSLASNLIVTTSND